MLPDMRWHRLGLYRPFRANVPALGMTELYDAARDLLGCPWVANGWRADDSMDRRVVLKADGAVNRRMEVLMPIADWSTSDVLDLVRHVGAVEQLRVGGRRTSGFELNADWMTFLAENHPADYARVLEAFPFAEAITYRARKFGVGFLEAAGTSPDELGPVATKYQTGTVERIHRSAIIGAEYNPRKITSTTAKRIREHLKRVGLLGPALVLNRPSMTLVSGHQRLAQLDVLEGSADYWLDMTVVELSAEEERQTNVFLNNKGAQGEFDIMALGALLDEGGLDTRAMGFSDLDLDLAFEGTEYSRAIDPGKLAAVEATTLDHAARAKAKADVKAARKRMAEQHAALSANDTEFYLVLVFRNFADAEVVLKALDGNREKSGLCLDGPSVAERLGIAPPPRA